MVSTSPSVSRNSQRTPCRVLNLNIRWEHGQLEWYDPATNKRIVTFGDERARADRAEAQVRELETELQRLRDARNQYTQ